MIGSAAEASHRPRAIRQAAAFGIEHGHRDAYLREFLDEFYSERDKDKRASTLADEPLSTESKPADAYYAAAAEHLALTRGLRTPSWTAAAIRFLVRPYFPSGLESLKAISLRESPIAFRRRMILVDANPLYRPRKETLYFTTLDRAPPMSLLAKHDILRGLSKLDDKARAAGVLIDLAIYGGAVLTMVFDARLATRDVDAIVRGSPYSRAFLRSAALDIALEEGWPPDWLNDRVKGFLSHNEDLVLMKGFQGSAIGGLRIYLAAPSYLFAMKCMAMRPDGIDGSHDVSDIEFLARTIGLDTPDEAFSIIEGFYPASEIPAKVRFRVEEIMDRLFFPSEPWVASRQEGVETTSKTFRSRITFIGTAGSGGSRGFHIPKPGGEPRATHVTLKYAPGSPVSDMQARLGTATPDRTGDL